MLLLVPVNVSTCSSFLFAGNGQKSNNVLAPLTLAFFLPFLSPPQFVTSRKACPPDQVWTRMKSPSH